MNYDIPNRRIIKLIGENGLRSYTTMDEDIAARLKNLEICKSGSIAFLAFGIFGWMFQARTQEAANRFEFLLNHMQVTLESSDLRSLPLDRS